MVNQIISNYFGIGIFVSIVLAFIFPFTAMLLSPLAMVFLFVLMFLSGLTIEWERLKIIFKNPKATLIGNFLVFLVIPGITYLFATNLLTDPIYIYGVVFASLTPTAIVAPFFTKILKGDGELSFSILVTSMTVSPIVVPIILTLMTNFPSRIASTLLTKDMLILIPLPLFLAYLVKTKFGNLSNHLKSFLPLLNFIFLALLIFILFGVSLNYLNFNYLEQRNLVFLLLIAFVQNFCLLLFLTPLNKYLFREKDKTIAMFTSVSMKNIAFAATILLLYIPKAALAPAIGFLAHSVLFTPKILNFLINKSFKS